MPTGPTGLVGWFGSLSARGLCGVSLAGSLGAIAATAGLGVLLWGEAAGRQGWPPAALAAGITAAASALGVAPIGLADASRQEHMTKAALLGTPIRMVSALAMAVAALLVVPARMRLALLCWLGGFYLATLAVETVLLAGWLWARRDISRT